MLVLTLTTCFAKQWMPSPSYWIRKVKRNEQFNEAERKEPTKHFNHSNAISPLIDANGKVLTDVLDKAIVLIFFLFRAYYRRRPTTRRRLLTIPYCAVGATGLLKVTTTKLKTSSRAFSHAAPKLWNSLPVSIWDCVTVGSFRKNLKTYLYNTAYSTWACHPRPRMACPHMACN